METLVIVLVVSFSVIALIILNLGMTNRTHSESPASSVAEKPIEKGD